MKKSRLILLVCALLILVGGAYFVFQMDFANQQPVLPTPPPVVDPEEEDDNGEAVERETFLDFAAEDQDGNPVRLSDFIDEPTIVFLWTSWCPACKIGMDELQMFYEEGSSEGIQILAVNLSTMSRGGDEAALGRTYMEESTFSFASIYDIYGEAQAAYRIHAVPLMLFVNADGSIAHQQLGALRVPGLVQYAALLQ